MISNRTYRRLLTVTATLVALLPLSAPALASESTWLDDTHDITTSSSSATQSAVAMAPNGSMAVAYVDTDGELYLARKPVGDDWASNDLIDPITSSDSDYNDQLAIAINSTGQVVVTFTRIDPDSSDSGSSVRAITYDPNSDSTTNLILDDADASHPQVALAEDGNAVVAWQYGSCHPETHSWDYEYDCNVRAKYLTSPLTETASWSSSHETLAFSGIIMDGANGDANEVALDVNSDGKLAVAWERYQSDGTGMNGDGDSDSDPNLVSRVVQARVFDSIPDIADATYTYGAETLSRTSSGSTIDFTETPDIEISDNGDTFVTWYSAYGTDSVIADSIYDADESAGSSASGSFQFGLDSMNYATESIYTSRMESDESEFEERTLLSDVSHHANGRPSVAVDANGNAISVWTQSAGTYQTIQTAAYSEEGYEDNHWFNCAEVDGADHGRCDNPTDGTSSDDVAASSAKVVMNPDGQAHVVWLDDSSNYKVRTNHSRYTIDQAIDLIVGQTTDDDLATATASAAYLLWFDDDSEDLETLNGAGAGDYYDHAFLDIGLDGAGNGIASWVDGYPGKAQIKGLDGAGPVLEEITLDSGDSSLTGDVGHSLSFLARAYDIWSGDVDFTWEWGDDSTNGRSSTTGSEGTRISVDTTISITDTPNLACAAASVTATSSGDYTWCSSVDHTYTEAGDYTVRLTATDDYEHEATEDGTVTINGTAATEECTSNCDPTVTTNTTTEAPPATTETTPPAVETPSTAATSAVLKIKAKKSQRLGKAAKAYFKKQVAKKSKKTRKNLLKKLLRKNPGILTYTASCSKNSCKATFKPKIQIKRKGKKTVTIKLGKVTKTLKKAGKSYSVVVKLTRKQYSKLRKTLKKYGKKAKVTAPVTATGKTSDSLALKSSAGKTAVKYTAKKVKP